MYLYCPSLSILCSCLWHSVGRYRENIIVIVCLMILIQVFLLFQQPLPNLTIFSTNRTNCGSISTCVYWICSISTIFTTVSMLPHVFGFLASDTTAPRSLDTLPLKKRRPQNDGCPLICFRVVTRGTFPQLVRQNTASNLQSCDRMALSNFIIEVVTGQKIKGLSSDARVRQTVLPYNYSTSTGALFKARALQYSLEPHVNKLAKNDWIVHLDEETILTPSSISGIIDFCSDGRYEFGEGWITYANQEIVCWSTTLADCIRVGDDHGRIAFSMSATHAPWFGMKGSFLVAKAGPESDVSFDHGVEGSIAEDTFFGLVAIQKGYSFGFVKGEMWEQSPYTLYDFLRQRMRWFRGVWLTTRSKKIKLAYKFPLMTYFYSWPISLVISAVVFCLSPFCALEIHPYATMAWSCYKATIYFLYAYGAYYGFRHRYRSSRFKHWSVIVLTAIASPAFQYLETAAVFCSIWEMVYKRDGKRENFYIVNKRAMNCSEYAEQTDEAPVTSA